MEPRLRPKPETGTGVRTGHEGEKPLKELELA